MARTFRVLTVLVVACLVALSLARFTSSGYSWLVMMAAFSSYALLGYGVVLLTCAFALGRSEGPELVWLGIAVSAIGVVVHIWWLAPLYAGGSKAEADLTVMTSNLQGGRGDAPTIVRSVKSEEVDLLVLEEVTPESLQQLDTAGLDKLLPNRAGAPALSAVGTMVFSRYPLVRPRSMKLTNGAVDVRVQAPKPFRLLAAHTAQPVVDPVPWLVDLEAVRDWSATSVQRGATLVVGDLNANQDHAPLRKVLATGLRDAAEQAGSGYQPTWPTRFRHSWMRAVVPLDHVLNSREFVALRTRTVSVPRTDHLALVADLEMRDAD